MSLRGHLDRRSIQAPGLMRHSPLPAVALIGRHPVEALHPLELMENRVAIQAAEIEKLARENKRLAASHVTLREDIIATDQEMQRVEAHGNGVEAEAGMQIRGLVESIRIMEADILAGDAVKQDLQRAHIEARTLVSEREKLSAEIRLLKDELQKVSADRKSLPELYSELDGLRQEHHNLRASFEYEKNSNTKQVEQIKTMEKNLYTMFREVEKLKIDVANAERKIPAAQAAAQAVAQPPLPTTPPPVAAQSGTPQAAAMPAAAYGNLGHAAYQSTVNPYAAMYENQAAAYQQAVQAGAYGAYGHGGAYPGAGYAQGPIAGYPGSSYPMPQHQIGSGAAPDAANFYTAMNNAGYAGGMTPASGANAAVVGQVVDPYTNRLQHFPR